MTTTTVPPIRVLLADDQSLLRAGLRLVVDAAPDLAVIGEAGTGEEAVRRARDADVVLMDIQMPGIGGIAASERITSDPRSAHTKVLVLTTFELDDHVVAALRAGASGFLGKSVEADELRRAIRTVAAGDALLSPNATTALIRRFLAAPQPLTGDDRALATLTTREREVLTLVAAGLSNDDIGQRLFISATTAKTHVNRAMLKLDARSRAQLVALAYQHGIAPPATGGIR